MPVKAGSAPRVTEANAKVCAPGATSTRMDAATAAYVRKHHLGLITRSVAQVLCSMEGDELRRLWHSKTGESALPEAMTALVDITLPLQVLLSSFVSLPSSASLGGMSKSSLKATSSLPLAQDAAQEEGLTVAASTSAALDMSDCFWPVNAAFANKEDAVKADVCHCLALHCDRFLTGRGLVKSFGGRLRWAHVAPDSDGGNERLGVALVLDVFRCWQQVVIPLLQRLSGSASKGAAAGSTNADDLFDFLVKRSPAVATPSSTAVGLVREEAAYWCFALLRGYCQDFPESVWASVLRAAQDAAVQQCDNSAGDLPPLTGEALLLRSFIAHLSRSESGAACVTPAAAQAQPLCDGIIASHMSAAVAAARTRGESCAWAEVELLQQASADTTALVPSMSALLCADTYWAMLLEPYAAMLAQYSM
ncbi:hypothetical protein LSCM1_01113 [Leishmania martiniquensis]|uniref:Uncharacterized protein n=1 Tax=Leishmania martiniquensis TaxID=1580590 RepID=A0A836G305_9TRYP|nr:hypothetical protein LSCM1_01113 [Leishmania martiniquensis]